VEIQGRVSYFYQQNMNADHIIEITELSKTYKHASEASVKGISFSIKRNEIFGLLGPNGAGKTTTLSMLCGLFPPTKGSVFIDGKDLRKELEPIQAMIGIVPQDIALYSTLTARENLSFYGHMYGLKGRALQDRIDLWLEKMGLSGAADRAIAGFSHGMKRRVNLIAGILHQPKILFLDEPTVGVDVQSRNAMIAYLKELNQGGMTIIYTSHHMEEAESFCTQVSIIDHGEILTAGSPAALIRSCPGAANLENVFLQLTNGKLRD
jgi:ABC-2 type transport system ATP-binding protein